MSIEQNQPPNVSAVLAGLKDFQRDTVEYVFRRMYEDNPPSRRFLVADEVGLGKTLVARGIIAKAVERLWGRVPRIDVVYVCANLDIAKQNIDRLNIAAGQTIPMASRLTLLPVRVRELRAPAHGTRLNFVSLTPHTSFDLRSSTGIGEERAVLFWLLREAWDVSEGPLSNVLRGDISRRNWRYRLQWFEREREQYPIDPELAECFYQALQGMPGLRRKYDEVAAEIGARRQQIPGELRTLRNLWIGEMRRLLARTCLSALEPDLIILDEFQRFRHLLMEDTEVGLLAQELFRFHDARILLLSATPYKMYTLRNEEGEDHYRDFERTVRFLLEDRPEELSALHRALEDYRRGIFCLGTGEQGQLHAAKREVERILRRVMVRTERLAMSEDRNGLLQEHLIARDDIQPSDLEGFVHLDRIAHHLKAGDQVEYWKSSPYVLNLMEEYAVKRNLADALKREDPTLANLLRAADAYLLKGEDIQRYRALDPQSARLRALLAWTLDSGNWQLLWMPAALPYYVPGGPFARVTPVGCTKTLVFSAWKVVPKAIAILASYEAERRMLGNQGKRLAYRDLSEKKKGLLRFARSKGRLVGMPLFCLLYPCLTLAREVDPLAIACRMAHGGLPEAAAVAKVVRSRIRQLLKVATTDVPQVGSGPRDDRWYWAALVFLDRHFNPLATDWLHIQSGDLAWARMVKADEDEDVGAFGEHIAEFASLDPQSLGRPPADLVDVLAQVALAGPAVVTLRALLRRADTSANVDQSELLAAAAGAALGFRTLFNQPEVTALLQQLYPGRLPYWKSVLRYAVEGNLQAVMDEYVHVLRESLGLLGHPAEESAREMAFAIRQALSIRSPTLLFDEISVTGPEATVKKMGVRCRYALRFDKDQSEEEKAVARAEDIRVAFNSPFRPFILATTSIGQEGLDFHLYCHRVVHWNLPSNPVDLEQREGRVHRYKGHVIRRNLARVHGLSAIQIGDGVPVDDPWQQIFERAVEIRRQRDPTSNDLVPFWICEATEGCKIERLVPVLPLSREEVQIRWLERSLVIYRSVLGQPRQQELLEFMMAQLPEGGEQLIREYLIDLAPQTD